MPTEILSGLWIGSIDDLKHPSFFEDMEINIIVNLTDCDFRVQKKVSYINLAAVGLKFDTACVPEYILSDCLNLFSVNLLFS